MATNPSSHPEDGLILATLDGKKQVGEAQLEVLNTSSPDLLGGPWMFWAMGEYELYLQPYAIDTYFYTDDDGIIPVQIYSNDLQDECFLNACLTGAINGKKRSVIIKFVYEDPSAINDIQNEKNTFDVYSINGTKLRSRVTSLDDLPRGLYIVNGRKIVK